MYKVFVKIVHRRLSGVIDPYLDNTQYGFRPKRSTSQAIHVIRRVADYAEMEGSEMHLLLLNWEKAFDRIKHEKLIESLKRMKVSPRIVRIIERLYAAPTFE
eukprot:4224555-Karenia_brevis.AAC.1